MSPGRFSTAALFLVGFSAAAQGGSDQANQPATTRAVFLADAVYATKSGCAQLKKIAKGGQKNVETVPEALTAEGFQGWEGGCSFKTITEIEPGRVWQADLRCVEGDTEDEITNMFVVDQKTRSVTVSQKGLPDKTEFFPCDAPLPKWD